jgi:5-methyltetrahydropteroyltriglutamate--homocysteine methyltransferase
MAIPTEPIGSIPPPIELIEARRERRASRTAAGCWRSSGEQSRPDQQIFVGVIDPISARVETVDQVRDRVLEAAEFIPVQRLGTTDDCGFSPFGDDISTSRETAFAKIRARVEGTAAAARELGR